MIRLTPRAGAFASAALMISLVSATGLTGAVAQDQVEPTTAPVAAALADGADTEAAAQPGVVRFVSEPVVQDVPAAAEPAVPRAATSLAALVASMPTDAALSPELTCLARAIYFEARGEPIDGQLAVARVIVNRATSGQFPDDYCSVITQRGQFSFVRGGTIPAANESSPAWTRARAIARIAHQDLWESAAGDSLFFHASHVRPRWAARRASVARIDRHIFYR